MVHFTHTLFGNVVKRIKWFGEKSVIYARGGLGGTVSDRLGLTELGGRGGHGGNVRVTACEHIPVEFSQDVCVKIFQAERGEMSSEEYLHGLSGNDIEIQVPPGVVLQNESGEVISDLNSAGDDVIIAHGTVGCSPANNFTRDLAKVVNITANLKHVADVGLVGFPGAGKSTFLNALSRSKPTTSKHSFTSVRPDIGHIEYSDGRMISLASVPDWTTQHSGVRHHFLAHLERTKLLLFIVDVSGFHLHEEDPQKSPTNTVILLNKHIELLNKSILNKPCLLVLNKKDLAYAEHIAEQTKTELDNLNKIVDGVDLSWGVTPDRLVKFNEVFTVSEKEKLNIDYVKKRLRYWCDLYEKETQSKISQCIEDEKIRREIEVNRRQAEPSSLPPIDFTQILSKSTKKYKSTKEHDVHNDVQITSKLRFQRRPT